MFKAKTLTIKIFFRIVFLLIAIGGLVMYYSLHRNYSLLAHDEYQIIGKLEPKGGRGKYYQIVVLYKGEQYTVDVTGKMYYGIDEGQLPKFYYSNNEKKVFTDWTVKVLGRVAILFGVLFLVTFLPLDRMTKQS